jgi:hypothetical protein
VIINLYKTIVIILQNREKMQYFSQFDFNMVYDLLKKLNNNVLSYFFSTGYDIDECFCGGSCSCSCDFMVSEKP